MDISFNYGNIIKRVSDDSGDEDDPNVMYMDVENGALRE